MNLPTTARVNRQGRLEIGGVDTVQLAEEFGTPLYVVDEATLREKCREYKLAFSERYPRANIVFAGKALAVTGIFRVIADEDLGADISSHAELLTVLKAGLDASRLYFHGNNKSPAEMEEALKAGVGRIVVDSRDELEILSEIAGKKKKKAAILLRINPNIEAHTHEYIQTARLDSKFGLDRSAALGLLKGIKDQKNLIFKGIHCHIGSQIFELKSFALAAEVMMDLVRAIKTETGIVCEEVNLGGGLGIAYLKEDQPPTVQDYAETVLSAVTARAKEFSLPLPILSVEPGRSLVGTAGITLYRVGVIKNIPGVRKYVSVDGGMADNPRPMLYEAKYDALVANKADRESSEMVTIAGRYCESGDILIKDIKLPPLERGDLLAVLCTGAYNYTMSSNYNRVPRPAMVLVREGKPKLILKRETPTDLVARDLS